MSLPDLPNLPDLNDAMEPTWPAAATHRLGPWLLREGAEDRKSVV